MAISNTYKVYLYYFKFFKWAKQVLVQINPAQPKIQNHYIRHSEKHNIAITRLRIEYLFQSALPAKIAWLVTACFFSSFY